MGTDVGRAIDGGSRERGRVILGREKRGAINGGSRERGNFGKGNREGGDMDGRGWNVINGRGLKCRYGEVMELFGGW